MKEVNKQTILLFRPVIFDSQIVRKLSFDLMHINEGWDELKNDYAYKGRSSYIVDNIVEFFEQFLFIQVEWEINLNKFEKKVLGVPIYRYVFDTTDEDGNMVRVILDIPKQFREEAVLVTIYMIGE
jgi:predicted translin family RNA/ssDNA-binding protein